MMLKKILITSATVTGMTLGVLGAQLKAESHPTDAASLNEQVNVKAVDRAVASLADVKSVQLSVSQAVAAHATVEQDTTPAATAPAEAEPVATPAPTAPAAAPAVVTPVATPAKPAEAAPVSGDLQWLIARESSGNVNAQNGPYYGIGQLSENYYAKYVRGQNYRGNYAVQLEAMQKYIADRYGTVAQAIAHWQANNWY